MVSRPSLDCKWFWKMRHKRNIYVSERHRRVQSEKKGKRPWFGADPGKRVRGRWVEGLVLQVKDKNNCKGTTKNSL